MAPHEDDSFTGYHLRGVEDTLQRLEWRLARVERKVDALATSSPELAAAIAQINAEAKKVTDATAVVAGVTADLNKTGV